MSEWKSWSLGGGPEEPGADGSHEGAPATPPPSPTPPGGGTPGAPAPDEAAHKWSDGVAPFDLDRLAHVLEGDGFPVGRAEFEIGTRVEQTDLRFHREPVDVPWLQVLSRVALPGADDLSAFDLQQVANAWNSSHLQPTAYPERVEGDWVFSLASRFFVGEGLSDRQIHLIVRRAVVVALQATRELPGSITPAPES